MLKSWGALCSLAYLEKSSLSTEDRSIASFTLDWRKTVDAANDNISLSVRDPAPWLPVVTVADGAGTI
jgi:hypothetical protein